MYICFCCDISECCKNSDIFKIVISDHEGCFTGEDFDKVLDSNDEEFSRFEPGSKDFLKDIPEGSAESIALSLLGED